MGIAFHFVNFTVKWKVRHRNRLAEQHDRRALSASLNCHNAHRSRAAVSGLGRLCVQEHRPQHGSAPTAAHTILCHAGCWPRNTFQLLHRYTWTFFSAAMQAPFLLAARVVTCWSINMGIISSMIKGKLVYASNNSGSKWPTLVTKV